MRNYLVVLNGHAVVALEGGAGTLSEIGLALKIGRKVIAVGQWSCLPGVARAVDPLHTVELLQAHLL
jgi:predicted Rossmann-fold nucleotide-binding protein